MEISFGKLDGTWQQYSLIQAPLFFNGKDTCFKGIIRKDQIVSIVHRGYELLPNEEAVKLGDEAATMAGLVPFDEFTGEWFVRMGDHVIYDKEYRRVHALYAANEHYEVNCEKMHVGVGVHNSIDGTLGFGCGIFTFRHACANMVFAGMRGYEQAFDQRKTIEYVYKRHTVSLSPFKQNLKNTILAVMDKATDVIRSYNLMAQEKATEELIKKIKRSRLSQKVLPEYLTAEEQTASLDLEALTEWQLYNDITERIWHNAKTGLKSKTFQFKTLHAVMPLAVK